MIIKSFALPNESNIYEYLFSGAPTFISRVKSPININKIHKYYNARRAHLCWICDSDIPYERVRERRRTTTSSVIIIEAHGYFSAICLSYILETLHVGSDANSSRDEHAASSIGRVVHLAAAVQS